MIFILLGFCCIWVVDIGVYFVGKFFGWIRFLEISLKKIVEGVVFGVLGSLGVVIIGFWYLDWFGLFLIGVVLGLIVGIVSLFGDLIEFMMKWDVGVKDFG